MLLRLLRHRLLLSLLLIMVLPWSIRGAMKAWESNHNDVSDWLPRDFAATREFAEFVARFGSDELLMISWEGCSLHDSRIAEYRQQLLTAVASTGGEPLFRQVLTGPMMVDYYAAAPLSMSISQANRRMAGWMISADGKTTCLVALVSAAGMADREAAVERAFAAADAIDGLSRSSVYIAGTTLEGVAVDQASKKNLWELNLASFGICLLIMLVCLRSVRAALLVFLLALFNEQLSMALIYYTGSKMDSILLLTANLTFVITISIGIHLVNYYRDAASETGAESAAVRAYRAARKPTLLAIITTVLGLASLAISEIVPIKRFGCYSAVAILLAMVITLVYVTLHFEIWPLRPRIIADRSSARPGNSLAGKRWMRWLSHAKWPLLLLAPIVVLAGGFGVMRLRTSVGLDELLSARTRALQDYSWLEERIGPLIPVEIVLELPAGDARELVRQFHLVDAVQSKLRNIKPVGAAISAVTFAADPPGEGGGVRQIARAAAFRRGLADKQKRLQELGFLSASAHSHYWRITLRTPSTQRSHYGELLAEIRETITSTVADQGADQPKSILVCGGVPLIFQTQQQLLKDLINSFLLAFGLVAVTLMILFRSVVCGAICMIPNLLPSAIVFGVMGWMDIPVEVGAILTASAALGVAVDDSLHFITWFRRKTDAGGGIAEAVAYAYSRCGIAMIQTTLICSFGLVVFSLSPFAPIAKFGLCMFSLLTVALLADLVLLPAILLSPLGRPFLSAETRLVNPGEPPA